MSSSSQARTPKETRGFPEPQAHPFDCRSAPRVAVSMTGSILLAGSPGWLPCRLRDIGTGGACLETMAPFALADLRRIRIDLPGAPLEASAIGRWQQSVDLEQAMLTGVQFDALERCAASRLRDLVHDRVRELADFISDRSDFTNLGLDEAVDLALFSRLRNAEAGRYLYRDGSPETQCDSVFLVVEGTVAMETTIRSRRVSVCRVEPGGVFGGISLLAPVEQPLSAVACAPVMLLELDRGSYQYIERAKPLVARRVSEVVIAQHVAQLRACIDHLVARLD